MNGKCVAMATVTSTYYVFVAVAFLIIFTSTVIIMITHTDIASTCPNNIFWASYEIVRTVQFIQSGFDFELLYAWLASYMPLRKMVHWSLGIITAESFLCGEKTISNGFHATCMTNPCPSLFHFSLHPLFWREYRVHLLPVPPPLPPVLLQYDPGQQTSWPDFYFCEWRLLFCVQERMVAMFSVFYSLFFRAFKKEWEWNCDNNS